MRLPADKARYEKEKKEKRYKEELTLMYKRVFFDDEAKFVLKDILSDLYFFADELKTEEEVALNNAAKNILKKTGVWIPDNTDLIMNALMSVKK